jgi:microcystin-dependent protein
VSDPYIGEIQAFPFAFAAQGFNQSWLPCFGQLLPIQQFVPLFSLIGTAFGGNGTSNFALPNLTGCITNGQGDGPGLQPRVLGESIGSATVNLISGEMAMHTHGLQLGIKTAANAAPGPGTSSNMAAIDPIFNGFVPLPSTTTLAPNAMTLTGQGLPHDNTQPTLAIVWCIAYTGIFPSFNNS